MRRIAIALGTLFATGCPSSQVEVCDNGAICPQGQACTGNSLGAGLPQCGPPQLVEPCRDEQDFTPCPYSDEAAASNTNDGTCRSRVCSPCTVDRAGCHYNEWHAMTAVDGVTELRGVWIGSKSLAYAVGAGGAVWKYDGWTWSTAETPPPTTARLTGIWGADEATLHAIGDDGHVYRLIDQAWTEVAIAPMALLSIWGSSGDHIVAVGDVDSDGGASIFQFDGTTWTAVPLPAMPQVPFNGVGGSSRNDVYAVGNSGTIIRYDGSTWSVSRAPAMNQPILNAVWAITPTEVYVVGSQSATTLLEGADMTWDASNDQLGDLFSVAALGSEAFAVGKAVVRRSSPLTWTMMSTPPRKDLFGTAAADGIVLAVGADGTIWRYTVTQ